MNFSKKIEERLERLLFCGYLPPEDRGMRRVVGTVGTPSDAIYFALYCLVDESDGVIAEAKFQAVGPPALLVALDAVCELLIRKNYSQASRLSTDLIDRHLRDKNQAAAFPPESAPLLNKTLDAIDAIAEQCSDIAFEATYEGTPIEEYDEGTFEGISGWEAFPSEQKLKIIEEVVAKEVRPYIELDAGGITVLGLRENGEVRIAYEGACTSCPSSAGSTLSAIQRILRSRVHPTLSVVPEFA